MSVKNILLIAILLPALYAYPDNTGDDPPRDHVIAVPDHGKNTATNNQEEPFRGWKKTETEHFVIIYEPKDREYAEDLLGFCEPVYDTIAGYFSSHPDKIPCVLRGRTDSANGFYSSLPSKIELYITAPTIPWMGAKHGDWLKILFIHELVHFIHFHYNHGFFYTLSQIFGESIRPSLMGFMPGWMTEGIAVYLETALTEGGRGRNPFFEIYYKAPIIEDRFFSLQKASYNSDYPPRGRIYVAGYLLIEYIMRSFGESVFSEIHDRYARFPFFGPRYAIEAVTGETVQHIFNHMKEELEEQYRDDAAVEAGERITPSVTGDYHFPIPTKRGLYLYRRTLDTPHLLSAMTRKQKKRKLSSRQH